MKFLATTLALSLLAGGAFAQGLTPLPRTNAQPLNQVRVDVAVQNSGTAVLGTDVAPFENVTVLCQGTTGSISHTILVGLADGSTTSATTVLCGTTMSSVASYAAAAFSGDSVLVSPSAGLTGTNSVKTLIVRKPSIYRQ